MTRNQLLYLILLLFAMMRYSIEHLCLTQRIVRNGCLRGTPHFCFGSTLDSLVTEIESNSSTILFFRPSNRNSKTVQYQGVRLANSTAISSFDSNYGTNTDDVSVIVGCALHDFYLDSHYFATQKTSQTNIQGRHTPVKVYPLRGPVNDFRFAHDGSLQGKPSFFLQFC